MTIARVLQLTKDHVRIEPSLGYIVTVFKLTDMIEAVVAAIDGEETVRLAVAAPQPGQNISIDCHENGAFDIVYKDIK